MKNLIYLTGICIIFAFAGCMSQPKTSNETKYKPLYKLQIGANHGGIIENTDLEQIPDTEVDAYSGATKTGFNAGVKVLFPIRKNAIETGLDYLFSNQSFNYQDNLNGYNGQRELSTSQYIVPLTYNIGLFRKKFEEGLFTVKLGYLIQYNSIKINDGLGNLPACEIIKFSNGPVFGLATSPFHFKNGSKLGFYIDVYRGTRIYQDFYNKKEYEMPGSSFLKYGLSYQF